LKEKIYCDATIATNSVEKRTLRDYAVPSLISATSCIKKPTINANNYELKMSMIHLVQNQY